MTKLIDMTETKLALISIFGFGVSLATVNQILQTCVLIVSLIAGILAIIKHFKTKK